MFRNGALGFVELEMKSIGMLDFATDLDNPSFAGIGSLLKPDQEAAAKLALKGILIAAGIIAGLLALSLVAFGGLEHGVDELA